MSPVANVWTDVPWAPTVGYLTEVASPVLKKLEYRAETSVLKRGYYPRGGGRVSVELKGADLLPLQLLDPGEILMIRGQSHASEGLRARQVAERQRKGVTVVLEQLDLPAEIGVEYGPTKSPGSGIDLWALAKHTVLGANALGARGKRAEEVELRRRQPSSDRQSPGPPSTSGWGTRSSPSSPPPVVNRQ